MGLYIVPDNHDSSSSSGATGKIVGTGELEKRRRNLIAADQEEAQVLLYQSLSTLALIAFELHKAQIQRLKAIPYDPQQNLYELLEEALDSTKQLADLSGRVEGVHKGEVIFLERELERLCESIAQRAFSNPAWVAYNPGVAKRIHAILRHLACLTIAKIPAEDIIEPPQD